MRKQYLIVGASETYMGKVKDRELVVLLFDRKEMLPKLGMAPEYIAKGPETEELDSPRQCCCDRLDSVRL
jgi:hypothetical protein